MVRLALPISLLLAAACASESGDARELEIANVVAHADEALIRSRASLVAGKYVRMAEVPIDFMRGTLPVYRHDVRDGTTDAAASRFALDAPLVPSIGDAHPENFGTLRASDGTFAVEPNDFDGADRAPYLWDVRRLASGVAVAAAESNSDDDAARARTAGAKRSIARAVAAAYVAGLDAVIAGAPPARVTSAGASAILDDLFSRSARDLAARRELSDMTDEADGVRRLKRGVLDPTDTQNTLADLPAAARAAIPTTLARYRETLLAPPPSAFFTVLDAVREFGSGVASWPRVRAIVLLRGPSDAPDDDVMVEIKELTDSGIAGLEPPGVYHDDLPTRLVTTSRAAWARPDAAPLWGASTWLGLPVQIREETQAHKTVRVSRMVGGRGTVDAITSLATTLGSLLARIHTAGPDGADAARAIRTRIGADVELFADEQADFGDTYADRILADQGRFIRSLHRLGPRLGIPFDATDRPNADVTALFGSPPPAPPPPDLP